MHSFASDNWAGICPEALQALIDANAGRAPAYGEDDWTRQASDHLRRFFATDCDVYFVFNGTAANSLALASLCQGYHSVICHEFAHIETNECGAPGFFSGGSTQLTVAGENGKLTPAVVQEALARYGDIHHPKPRAISLTQATEVGTVYHPEEITAITDLARQHQLRVHMDGARLTNALISLNAAPADLTWRAGVDVLCFGGTKAGLAIGEVVVFFDRTLSEDFAWRCKQAGQLASKMRFLSAPWCGILDNDNWLRHSAHANAMAQRLAQGIHTIPGTKILFPVESNGVFISLPVATQKKLRERGWHFHTVIGAEGVRLMCAWNTTSESVDGLLSDLREISSQQNQS